jgi:hypothetical protein
MRRVEFDPSTLTGTQKVFWDSWSARAAAATQKVVADVLKGDDPKFNDAIWKELKVWLLDNVFAGRCAYCDSRAKDATDNPAAEHWRPKRAPEVVVAGKRTPVSNHSGYFWLAYDWRNLVPACSQCNSNGKGNLFPVAKAHVTAGAAPWPEPADLDKAEDPLLLHPYFGDPPDEHLRFGEGGIVSALNGSARGVESIRCFKLSREGLEADRKDQQNLALLSVELALNVSFHAAKTKIDEWRRGGQPHGQAAVDYVRLKLTAKRKTEADALDELDRDLDALRAFAAEHPTTKLQIASTVAGLAQARETAAAALATLDQFLAHI